MTSVVAGCGETSPQAVGLTAVVDCSTQSPAEAAHETTRLLPERVTVIFGGTYPGLLMIVYTVVWAALSGPPLTLLVLLIKPLAAMQI